jgi:signal transduction histidine kinase/ligand-binding sensor domain-containing protein
LLAVWPASGLDSSKKLTQYSQRVWQQEDGLPQPTVYALLQSHDGYLWLGTQGNLVRFDGVRFTTFDGGPNAFFGQNLVRALYEDPQHNLWIGATGGGLVRFSNGTFSRYTQSEGLPDDAISCIAPDRQGGLWVCTQKGLAHFRDNHFTVYTTEQGLPTNRVRTVCQDSEGAVWVAGLDFGLSKWDGTRFETVADPPFPAAAGVRALVCEDNGLWAATESGLFHLGKGANGAWTGVASLKNVPVTSLVESGDGSLWFGTREGFGRWKDGEVSLFRAKDGLSHSTVLSLAQDREGSIWVGTKNGLNQFFDGRVTPYTVSEGLPSNDTGPVYEDRDGVLWVGTLDAGLAHFDGRRFLVLTRKEGLPSNTVYTLGAGPHGDIWVGTSAGLARLHEGRIVRTYTRADGLPDNVIRALYPDSKGNLWVGTARGLSLFQNDRFQTIREAGLGGASVIALGGGRHVQLFVGIEGGGMVYLLDGQFRRFKLNDPFSSDIDSFLTDPDHKLWIGSLGGGLRRYRNGEITMYTVRDGLFDQQIYHTLDDDHGNLWMASSKGIFRVSKQELDDFAEHRAKTITSYPFSTGSVRFECKAGVQPGGWKTRDGRLWFSTTRGLVVIDPLRLPRNSLPPQVIVEDVSVNGQKMSPSQLTELPSQQNNLEFRYTGLSFVSPERLRFRYILEGFDKQWTAAGPRREASYTNLPHGHFRFRVTACNSDGVCNDAGESVAFTVVPAIYQRPWFLPLCAVALAFAGWLAYQFRVRQIEAQFKLVLAERSRIARELHDTLLQGLSAVTMQMKALSNRLPTSAEKRTLDAVIEDAAACLSEARRSLWGLRTPDSEGSGLGENLERLAEQMTEASPIRLHLKVDRQIAALSPKIEFQLLRIAQEALTNSMRHSEARNVEVALRQHSGEIHLAVKDDGRGFDTSHGTAQFGHYGIVGMRERVAEIGAELSVSSELGVGTEVDVILPVPGGVGALEVRQAPPASQHAG